MKLSPKSQKYMKIKQLLLVKEDITREIRKQFELKYKNTSASSQVPISIQKSQQQTKLKVKNL